MLTVCTYVHIKHITLAVIDIIGVLTFQSEDREPRDRLL